MKTIKNFSINIDYWEEIENIKIGFLVSKIISQYDYASTLGNYSNELSLSHTARRCIFSEDDVFVIKTIDCVDIVGNKTCVHGTYEIEESLDVESNKRQIKNLKSIQYQMSNNLSKIETALKLLEEEKYNSDDFNLTLDESIHDSINCIEYYGKLLQSLSKYKKGE